VSVVEPPHDAPSTYETLEEYLGGKEADGKLALLDTETLCMVGGGRFPLYVLGDVI
jgi:hypothetical protein